MASVAGFAVLRVQYGAGAQKSKPIHHMYVRPHIGAETDTLPGGRTLFVVNVPPDATRGTLRDLFRKAGAVESVYVHDMRKTKGDASDDDEEEEEEADYEEDAGRTQASRAPNHSKKQGPPRVHPLPALAPNMLWTSGSSAHVVFLDASSLERAMQFPARSTTKPFAWPQPGNASVDEDESRKPRKHVETRLVGLPFLLERYRMHRPEHAQIKRHVDSAIARHTWIREHPQWLIEQRKAGDTTTSAGVGIEGVSVGPDGELRDADGFTIVQKGNKYGRSGGEDNTFAAITPEFEEMMRTQPEKKKSKELVDFYRFQFREKKRQQFAALRAQFEADKHKVAQRKASMRFKPY